MALEEGENEDQDDEFLKLQMFIDRPSDLPKVRFCLQGGVRFKRSGLTVWR
ncbi:hypothetical protein PanWU01x14_034220 [Parasponia andersonii]|uniref:Uncharacterized protein n=1 Tax=Parasponia andersonii TaxID=3476 RepID=A0A2P5DSW3_PARAD|nr:hypothetical protein PanWU01x14_034220 [Parasponia andersonii]